MTRKDVEDHIKKYESAGNKVYGFYIGYNPFPNALAQRWGKIDEFEKVLDDVEKTENTIEGQLPIVRLIVYSDTQCLAIAKNNLWNCVDDMQEDSHVVVVVPYIAKDGWFGNEIISERNGKNN